MGDGRRDVDVLNDLESRAGPNSRPPCDKGRLHKSGLWPMSVTSLVSARINERLANDRIVELKAGPRRQHELGHLEVLLGAGQAEFFELSRFQYALDGVELLEFGTDFGEPAPAPVCRTNRRTLSRPS